MAKISRVNGNVQAFASAAPGTERTLFGEITQSNDLTAQFTADFLRGWGMVGPSDSPALEDFNGAMYTHGQLLAYLHQMGVPEYNAQQEYHQGSVCTSSGVIFVSRINTNVGNSPASTPAAWAGIVENGRTKLTASGNFTVPAGVYQLWVSAVAGGGGGGAGGGAAGSGRVGAGGGGGGAGESAVNVPIAVTPGQVIAVVVGIAGSAGAISPTGGNGGSGGNGGPTSFGASLSLTGGMGGGGGANQLTGNAAGPSGGAGFPAGSYGDDSTNGNASAGGGAGASSPYGGGGARGRGGNAGGTAGTAAGGYGAGGGGGGGSYTAATGNGGAGGAGTGGIVIVEY